MNAVMDHSAARGIDLLVLVAIARHANPDGGGAYPSIDTIAAMVKVSRSTVIRALDRLEAAGELLVHKRAGPKAVNAYVVVAAHPKGSVIAVTPPEGAQAVSNQVEAVSNRVSGSVKSARGSVKFDTSQCHSCDTQPNKDQPLDQTEPGEQEEAFQLKADSNGGRAQHEGAEQDETVQGWLKKLGVPTEDPHAVALVDRFGEDQAAYGLQVVSGIPAQGLQAVKAAAVLMTEWGKEGTDFMDAMRLAEVAAKDEPTKGREA
jgi:hypothetical protein